MSCRLDLTIQWICTVLLSLKGAVTYWLNVVLTYTVEVLLAVVVVVVVVMAVVAVAVVVGIVVVVVVVPDSGSSGAPARRGRTSGAPIP